MTEKKKLPATGTSTAPKTAINRRYHTENNHFLGCYSLIASVKLSRTERQKKRGKKQNSLGRIAPAMAANIVLLVVVTPLILGVIHA